MAGPLTLAIVGDVMLGRLVNQVISQKGFGYPWGDVLPVLQQADLFLINLECTMTAHTQPWHDGEYKVFYFRAEPSVVDTLKIGGVAFAAVGNNHIGDFGAQGLLETLAVLDRAGIAHTGAGPNLAAARAPAVLSSKGVRVGVVAFADYPLAWAATETTPGINYIPISLDPEDFAPVERVLATARQHADLVVFTIHWGPNMQSRPPDLFRAFARRVIDAGADLFWGHSAHLVQGIEVYGGKAILYDTGDFVDDYAVDPLERNDLSALFLVQIRPPVVERIDLVPVCISDMQVNLAAEPEKGSFIRRLARLCREMDTELKIDADRVSVHVS